jgi:hypothetical protein
MKYTYSQLIRNSRACGSYQDFLDKGLLLARKLLNQGFLVVKLKSLLRKYYGRHHNLVNRYGISVSQMTTGMFRSFPHSSLITGFATRVTRRVPLVEHELLTLTEHLSLPPVFSGVRVTRSLVLCVMFCRSLFVLLFFFFWLSGCLSCLPFLVSSNSS